MNTSLEKEKEMKISKIYYDNEIKEKINDLIIGNQNNFLNEIEDIPNTIRISDLTKNPLYSSKLNINNYNHLKDNKFNTSIISPKIEKENTKQISENLNFKKNKNSENFNLGKIEILNNVKKDIQNKILIINLHQNNDTKGDVLFINIFRNYKQSNKFCSNKSLQL